MIINRPASFVILLEKNIDFLHSDSGFICLVINNRPASFVILLGKKIDFYHSDSLLAGLDDFFWIRIVVQ